MEYRIHQDGSFDFRTGDIRLSGGYPAVDGKSVRPIRLSVTEDSAEYVLEKGTIRLQVLREADTLVIRAETEGFEDAHDISPLAFLTIEGCDRAFYQGFGLGDPTGFRDVSEETGIDSYVLTAFGNDTACAALCVRDQTKYQSRYLLHSGMADIVFDTEKTLSGTTRLPDVYLTYGATFDEVLRGCARSVAETMRARTPKRSAFHWCSWYYLYHTLDQDTLEEYLAEFTKYRDIAPFSHIQIDAGYFDSCGDWLDPYYRFPKGLKYAADTIRAAGYEPGIWIGPFMVGEESRVYREHPDWVLRDLENRPMSVWHQYNEPKVWGYRDSEYYVLDTSHPDAMAYIVGVFKTLREWGYTLFKTDFMKWGMQDSSKVIRHTPGKTSFEYFREFLENVRAAIGDSAWLGCIAPFAPFIGYADMMRIGGDVGAQWEDSGFGPSNMIMEITGCQYFNNVYWQNDPDAVLLRDFHISLTDDQVEALALLQSVSGGVITTSDPVHLLGDKRKDLLRRIVPEGVADARFPYWQEKRDEIVIVNGEKVYIMNPTPHTIAVSLDWKTLVGYDTDLPNVIALKGKSGKLFEVKRRTV